MARRKGTDTALPPGMEAEFLFRPDAPHTVYQTTQTGVPRCPQADLKEALPVVPWSLQSRGGRRCSAPGASVGGLVLSGDPAMARARQPGRRTWGREQPGQRLSLDNGTCRIRRVSCLPDHRPGPTHR